MEREVPVKAPLFLFRLPAESDKMSVNDIGIKIAYKQMKVIKTKGRFHLLN